MERTLRKADRSIAIVTVGAALLGLGLLGAHNISNPNLWWDEAGQYWMSQGQSHSSPYATAPGSVLTGIELGRHGSNLDPLGFTVALRAWIDVFGTTAGSLRALPFLSYVLCFPLSVYIARRLVRLPWTVAVAIPLIVLTADLSLNLSTEIRAFSLEMLWVLVTSALILRLTRTPTVRRSVVLSSVLVVATVTSRYSYLVAGAAAVVTVVLITALRGRSNRKWLFAVIVASGFAVAALFALWDVGLWGDAGQLVPAYVGSGLLSQAHALGDIVDLGVVNLVWSVNAFTGAFVVVGALATLAILRGAFPALLTMATDECRPSSDADDGAIHRLSATPWFVLLTFVIAYEGLAVVLSIAGLAPWNAAGRWSIGLAPVALLSAFGLASIGVGVAHGAVARTKVDGPARARWTIGLCVGLVVLGVMAASIGLRQLGTFRHTSPTSLVAGLTANAPPALLADPTATWVVHPLLWPSFRYWAEASGLTPTPPITATPFSPFDITGNAFEARVRDAVACRQEGPTALVVPLFGGSFADTSMRLSSDAAAKGCLATSYSLSRDEFLAVLRPSD